MFEQRKQIVLALANPAKQIQSPGSRKFPSEKVRELTKTEFIKLYFTNLPAIPQESGASESSVPSRA
jgi:hypothetical protein